MWTDCVVVDHSSRFSELRQRYTHYPRESVGFAGENESLIRHHVVEMKSTETPRWVQIMEAQQNALEVISKKSTIPL